MANTNINPFAPTSAIPASYPLSTSLDENSAQKGAAASTAYALKRMITGDFDVIDPNELAKSTLYIDTGNERWLISYAQQNGLKSVSYTLNGVKKIRVSCNGSSTVRFAIVTDTTPTDLASIDFASGESLRSISPGKSAEFEIPNDAARVVFNWNSEFIENPFGFVVITQESQIDEIIKEKMTGNDESANRIIVAASNTPEHLAAAADVKCTGVNDETILNDAIKDALKKECTVLLLRGDYYLDAATKKYDENNDTFLLVDTSPVTSGGSSRGIIITGEDAFHRPNIHVSNSAYEALDSNTQYRVLGVKDSTRYGGYVMLDSIRIRLPYNQKKICAIDMVDYGGWARIHNTDCHAFTSGYNGQTIDMSNPPRQAVDGCIGIRFIGKGPNGGYGSEIFNGTIAGFNEGVSINTEWTVCYHISPYFCVKSWVFGRYTRDTVHSSQHPTILLMCGSERSNSPALFYQNSGFQQIEIIAFSMERGASICPTDANGNKVLGPLAKVEGGSGNGLEFRGSISYTVFSWNGSANNPNVGFWEFGHGHGMKTTDASHAQAGPTSLRNTYRPNFMQRYFDTSLGTNGKEIICIDESGNNGKGTWVDAMGTIV